MVNEDELLKCMCSHIDTTPPSTGEFIYKPEIKGIVLSNADSKYKGRVVYDEEQYI